MSLTCPECNVTHAPEQCLAAAIWDAWVKAPIHHGVRWESDHQYILRIQKYLNEAARFKDGGLDRESDLAAFVRGSLTGSLKVMYTETHGNSTHLHPAPRLG